MSTTTRAVVAGSTRIIERSPGAPAASGGSLAGGFGIAEQQPFVGARLPLHARTNPVGLHLVVEHRIGDKFGAGLPDLRDDGTALGRLSLGTLGGDEFVYPLVAPVA